MTTTHDESDTLTDALKEAVGADEVRFSFTWGFSVTGTRQGVLIEYRNGHRGKWSKFPFAVYETDEEKVPDIMHMLATMRQDVLYVAAGGSQDLDGSV